MRANLGAVLSARSRFGEVRPGRQPPGGPGIGGRWGPPGAGGSGRSSYDRKEDRGAPGNDRTGALDKPCRAAKHLPLLRV
jgi:hypothetical protein